MWHDIWCKVVAKVSRCPEFLLAHKAAKSQVLAYHFAICHLSELNLNHKSVLKITTHEVSQHSTICVCLFFMSDSIAHYYLPSTWLPDIATVPRLLGLPIWGPPWTWQRFKLFNPQQGFMFHARKQTISERRPPRKGQQVAWFCNLSFAVSHWQTNWLGRSNLFLFVCCWFEAL